MSPAVVAATSGLAAARAREAWEHSGRTKPATTPRDETQTPVQPQPFYGAATPFQADVYYGTTPGNGLPAPQPAPGLTLGEFAGVTGIILMLGLMFVVVEKGAFRPRAARETVR